MDIENIRVKLSIVTTLYQSASHVREFHQRASAAATGLGGDYELIMVNDGSPDGSLDVAVTLQRSDPHLIVVDLSRNFGHHKAMMTGLSYAQGERIFLIDSDLEEEPEWLAAFDLQLQGQGCDVVYGVQSQRKGGWFERLTGGWFYTLFTRLSGMTLPRNMVTARLMRRRYVTALLRHTERELDIGGLWHITGFDQRPRQVTKHSCSTTTYTFRRKVSLLINSVTSFSSRPLVYIFYLGLLVSAGSAFNLVMLVMQWLWFDQPVSGWTSVMASIWLLGGWIILFIGIIGIYLAKVFVEIKGRPYTIVRHVYGGVANAD